MTGAELELLASPIDGLTLQAGLGYLDAEYTELELPALSTLNAFDTVDLKGNQPASSPEWNFNFAAEYQFAITSKIWTRIRLDGNYVDDQWFSAYNNLDGHDDIRQDAYWLLNSRLTFMTPDERISVSGWVQNLTDEEYANFAINLQSGFGYIYFLDGRPRAWGVDFTYRF